MEENYHHVASIVPVAVMSDVVTNTDTFLSSTPSRTLGHTFIALLLPSVTVKISPRGNPMIIPAVDRKKQPLKQVHFLFH